MKSAIFIVSILVFVTCTLVQIQAARIIRQINIRPISEEIWSWGETEPVRPQIRPPISPINRPINRPPINAIVEEEIMLFRPITKPVIPLQPSPEMIPVRPNVIGQISTTTEQAPPVSTPPPARVQQCLANCRTTQEYNPVCASDGNTYHNRERLNCQNFCTGLELKFIRLGTCQPL